MIASTEQLAERVGVSAACQALVMPRSSLYRARKITEPVAAPTAVVSPRALPPIEKAEVRLVLNSERFADQPPREVYATLLDEGKYLCSWRTMYRILDENQEVRERRNQLRHPNYAKPELLATSEPTAHPWRQGALKNRQISLGKKCVKTARYGGRMSVSVSRKDTPSV